MAWLALVANIVLQTVITALLGLSLSAADSLLLLALAAAASMVLGAVVARVRGRVEIRRGSGLRRLAWLNVWTAVSFIAFFLGVAVHSAGVVFTLEASFAPLGVTVWTAFRAYRGDNRALPGRAQWCEVVVPGLLGTSLVAVMASSDPGGMIALLVAAVLGVVAGVAAGGTVIVSRELGRDEVGVGQVMAHRFYATGVFAVTALLTLIPCGLLAPPGLHVGILGVAALGSVVAPLFLAQYAAQRLAPIALAAGLATMPAITIAIELASGRAVGWMVLLLGALIVPANLVLLATQSHKKWIRSASFLSRPTFSVLTEHALPRITCENAACGGLQPFNH